MVLIGLACLIMAGILAFQDPFTFDPDPHLQAIVWAGFAVACFVAAWNYRNWRPPPEDGKP
jgi:hypothetical protein